NGTRQRPDMIEREGKREDATARDQAISRLEADDTAGAGRVPHAAASVAAQRQREEAGGDPGTRPRRRAARVMIGVPGVPRRRPWQVETGTADGEFVRGQLAQDDGAGPAQP